MKADLGHTSSVIILFLTRRETLKAHLGHMSDVIVSFNQTEDIEDRSCDGDMMKILRIKFVKIMTI